MKWSGCRWLMRTASSALGSMRPASRGNEPCPRSRRIASSPCANEVRGARRRRVDRCMPGRRRGRRARASVGPWCGIRRSLARRGRDRFRPREPSAECGPCGGLGVGRPLGRSAGRRLRVGLGLSVRIGAGGGVARRLRLGRGRVGGGPAPDAAPFVGSRRRPAPTGLTGAVCRCRRSGAGFERSMRVRGHCRCARSRARSPCATASAAVPSPAAGRRAPGGPSTLWPTPASIAAAATSSSGQARPASTLRRRSPRRPRAPPRRRPSRRRPRPLRGLGQASSSRPSSASARADDRARQRHVLDPEPGPYSGPPARAAQAVPVTARPPASRPSPPRGASIGHGASPTRPAGARSHRWRIDPVRRRSVRGRRARVGSRAGRAARWATASTRARIRLRRGRSGVRRARPYAPRRRRSSSSPAIRSDIGSSISGSAGVSASIAVARRLRLIDPELAPQRGDRPELEPANRPFLLAHHLRRLAGGQAGEEAQRDGVSLFVGQRRERRGRPRPAPGERPSPRRARPRARLPVAASRSAWSWRVRT